MAKENSDYVTVYTGSEVNVQHLQNLMDEEAIDTVVKNNFESGLRSGFGGGLPGQVQLLVHREQAGKAQRIVDQTFPQQETDEQS